MDKEVETETILRKPLDNPTRTEPASVSKDTPAVETALRAVARKLHATRKADPNATGAPIDPTA